MACLISMEYSAVAGGLIVPQLLTLYIAPVVYYYMDRIRERIMESFRIGGHASKEESVGI